MILRARLDQREDHPLVVAEHLHAGVAAARLEVEVLREKRARLIRRDDGEIQVIEGHDAVPFDSMSARDFCSTSSVAPSASSECGAPIRLANWSWRGRR